MRQVSGCIAIRKKEILIISARHSDKWVLPKGGVEKNESTEEAASRELLEEAGVTATDFVKIHEMIMQRKSGKQNSHWYICTIDKVQQNWLEEKERKRLFVSIEKAKQLLKADLLPILDHIPTHVL